MWKTLLYTIFRCSALIVHYFRGNSKRDLLWDVLHVQHCPPHSPHGPVRHQQHCGGRGRVHGDVPRILLPAVLQGLPGLDDREVCVVETRLSSSTPPLIKHKGISSLLHSKTRLNRVLFPTSTLPPCTTIKEWMQMHIMVLLFPSVPLLSYPRCRRRRNLEDSQRREEEGEKVSSGRRGGLSPKWMPPQLRNARKSGKRKEEGEGEETWWKGLLTVFSRAYNGKRRNVAVCDGPLASDIFWKTRIVGRQKRERERRPSFSQGQIPICAAETLLRFSAAPSWWEGANAFSPLIPGGFFFSSGPSLGRNCYSPLPKRPFSSRIFSPREIGRDSSTSAPARLFSSFLHVWVVVQYWEKTRSSVQKFA